MKNYFLLSFLFATACVMAQAPDISYNTPNVFNVGQAVTPLVPTNSGGAIVPAIVVSTFAGSGAVGATDATGTAASFNLPTVVTTGPDGILYVVDRSNNKIRKISATGEVTTFAGSGVYGYADGVGILASFRYPDGAVADSNGNLFVSDQSNHLIRKITPDGIVTTFAGTSSIGSTNGNGTAAAFYYPAGMAIDTSDNLYIADYGNNKIRKITPAGDVTTYAGTGTAGDLNGPATDAMFNGATGVATDAAGNVYVADYYNHKIKKINTLGDVSTVAGSGIAGADDEIGILASFNLPAIVAVDIHGNLFITDEGNNKIRKISPDGKVTTFAGTGTIGAADGEALTAEFNGPTGIVVDDSDRIFICDYGNNKIRRINQYNYRISPTLPDGLFLIADTGNIGGTPTVISPSTDYTVTAENADGSDSFVVNITVDAALGVSHHNGQSLAYYPNPVQNTLTISDRETIDTVIVSDLSGRQIVIRQGEGNVSQIDFSNMANGVYLIIVKTAVIEKRFKIVKL